MHRWKQSASIGIKKEKYWADSTSVEEATAMKKELT